MKKIFVTVAEFLYNGGKLEVGRDIYTNNIGHSLVGTFEKLGDNKDFFYYKSNITGVVIDRETYNRYVKVDCTPIYV